MRLLQFTESSFNFKDQDPQQWFLVNLDWVVYQFTWGSGWCHHLWPTSHWWSSSHPLPAVQYLQEGQGDKQTSITPSKLYIWQQVGSTNQSSYIGFLIQVSSNKFHRNCYLKHGTWCSVKKKIVWILFMRKYWYTLYNCSPHIEVSQCQVFVLFSGYLKLDVIENMKVSFVLLVLLPL